MKLRGFLLFVVVAVFTSLCAAQHTQDANAATSGQSASLSARNAAPAAAHVVLKVGNVQVTQAEFESWMEALEMGKDNREAEDRKALGDNYASVLMLSQQAVANRLDSSPEVIRQLAMARLQVLSNAEYALLTKLAKPTPIEISDYYDTHLSEYDTAKVRRLFIWKNRPGAQRGRPLTAQEMKTRVDAIKQALAKDPDPKKIAAQYDNDKDVIVDPEPLFFRRSELPSHMAEVAFSLKPGEWGVVEDTPDRLVTIQLVGRGRQNMKEVASLIEQRLQNRKLKAELDELKKTTGVWMDDKYFATAAAPGSGEQKPGPSPRPQQGKKEKGNEDERQN